MRRTIALLLALGGLAAGCGGRTPPAALVDRPPPAKDVPVAVPAPPPRRTRVVVRIVDGDTGRPVRGASVRIGGRRDRTGPRGNARLQLRRRAPLVVHVAKPGYARRALRMPFQRRLEVAIRIYRPAAQWTMYGATAARTHAHDAIRLRPPFRIVWSRGVGALMEFPAVVSNGFAYVGNIHGTVRAISMRDGKVAWRRDERHGKMAASPAVFGNALVLHGMDGIVRVLDRRTGRLLWRHVVGSPIESSPIVRDGVDYFGAWNGRIYALDLRRRRVRWVYRSGYKVTSSAALAGTALYIGDYGGRLLALRTRDGALRWARSVNGRIYGTPAVAAGRVFVPSSTGGSVTAFSTRGRYLWRVGTGSYVYSSPAVWRGRVFFGSYNGVLYAVSARSGAVRWTVGTGGPISGAAVVVGGVAYAGSFAHRILGVDARSGRVVLRFPHGEYVPVSGNGGRLLLHGYSRLYAVEPLDS